MNHVLDKRVTGLHKIKSILEISTSKVHINILESATRVKPRGLDLHSNKNVRRIDPEGRFSHDRSADVHQGVEEVSQSRGRPFQSDDEGRTLETIVGQIEKSDNAVVVTVN
jgi:hypothetical protein